VAGLMRVKHVFEGVPLFYERDCDPADWHR
jgi:hypothetical protein